MSLAVSMLYSTIKSNFLSKFYFGENRAVDHRSEFPRKRKSNALILTQQSGE